MATETGKKFERYKTFADVHPDRLDLRDRMYQPTLAPLPESVPETDLQEAVQSYIDADMVLDQGQDGACTGYALAAVIDFLSWRKARLKLQKEQGLGLGDRGMQVSNATREASEAQWQEKLQQMKSICPQVSPRMLYHLARFYDEWPGEENKGSSLRGAMKAWHRHGVCSEACWESPLPFKSPKVKDTENPEEPDWAEDAATRPLGVYYRVDRSSVVDMQAGIHETGAIVASGYVHDNWQLLLGREYHRPRAFDSVTHEKLPRIQWTADIDRTFMHAFALVGYNKYGFIVQNSWGKEWGVGGFAVLSYDDWIANGVDAWVAILGVPMHHHAEPQRVFVESENPGSRYSTTISDDQSMINTNLWKRNMKGVNGTGAPAATLPEPDTWPMKQCYEHTVILGSNGRAINRLIETQNASSAIDHIARELPAKKFAQWHGKKKSAKVKIAIYAFSGLSADWEEVRRIRLLGPCYENNQVYPIFIGWRNGFLDSFLDLAGGRIMDMLPRDTSLVDMLLGDRDQRVMDAWDRTLELMFESEGGKPMWTQFKQDALLSAQQTRMFRRLVPGESKAVPEEAGLELLARGLGQLKREWPKLEIHLVGHSGGAITLAHLLAALSRALSGVDDQPIKSCTLYAPACSLFLANWRFKYYMTKTRNKKKSLMDPRKFSVHVLSDELEQADSVGPYRKSFLYLVSNALEDWGPIPTGGESTPSGTPVLGMARASSFYYFHPATHGVAEEWRTLCEELQIPEPMEWKDARVAIAPNIYADPSHESFPDNVKIANQTLLRITGRKELVAPVTNLNSRTTGQ